MLVGRKNALAGTVAVAVGAFVTWQSLGYSLGTASRMGPGFLPLALGLILILLGGLILLQALGSSEGIDQVRWRPLVVIPGALVLFALLIDRIGFVPTAIVTTIVAGLAEKRIPKIPLAVLALFMTVVCYVIFVLILGLRVPLWVWNP